MPGDDRRSMQSAFSKLSPQHWRHVTQSQKWCHPAFLVRTLWEQLQTGLSFSDNFEGACTMFLSSASFERAASRSAMAAAFSASDLASLAFSVWTSEASADIWTRDAFSASACFFCKARSSAVWTSAISSGDRAQLAAVLCCGPAGTWFTCKEPRHDPLAMTMQ